MAVANHVRDEQYSSDYRWRDSSGLDALQFYDGVFREPLELGATVIFVFFDA